MVVWVKYLRKLSYISKYVQAMIGLINIESAL